MEHICAPEPSPEIKPETAIRDDFASRRARAYQQASRPRHKSVHFGPVTEIDQQKWKQLSIGRTGPREDVEEVTGRGSEIEMNSVTPASAATSGSEKEQMLSLQNDCRYFWPHTCKICMGITAAFKEPAEAH